MLAGAVIRQRRRGQARDRRPGRRRRRRLARRLELQRLLRVDRRRPDVQSPDRRWRDQRQGPRPHVDRLVGGRRQGLRGRPVGVDVQPRQDRLRRHDPAGHLRVVDGVRRPVEQDRRVAEPRQRRLRARRPAQRLSPGRPGLVQPVPRRRSRRTPTTSILGLEEVFESTDGGGEVDAPSARTGTSGMPCSTGRTGWTAARRRRIPTSTRSPSAADTVYVGNDGGVYSRGREQNHAQFRLDESQRRPEHAPVLLRRRRPGRGRRRLVGRPAGQRRVAPVAGRVDDGLAVRRRRWRHARRPHERQPRRRRVRRPRHGADDERRPVETGHPARTPSARSRRRASPSRTRRARATRSPGSSRRSSPTSTNPTHWIAGGAVRLGQPPGRSRKGLGHDVRRRRRATGRSSATPAPDTRPRRSP